MSWKRYGTIEKSLAQWMPLPFFRGVYPFFLFNIFYLTLFFNRRWTRCFRRSTVRKENNQSKKGTKEKLYFLWSFLAPPPPTCSQIHSPLLGDKVDYGIVLSYRPASLCILTAGTTTLCHSQLYPPSQGLWIGPVMSQQVFYNITFLSESFFSLCNPLYI